MDVDIKYKCYLFKNYEYLAYLHTTQNAYMQKLYIANMVCDIYTIFAYINIKLSEIIFIKIIKGLYKKKTIAYKMGPKNF